MKDFLCKLILAIVYLPLIYVPMSFVLGVFETVFF